MTVLALVLLSGCASVPGPKDERDPLESFNRAMYSFNDTVDKAVIKPVAEVYKENTPQPVQTGVSNFFSNLDDIFVFLNDVLQFKFAQAASDLSRLLWNTTVGLGGFIDVASHMDLPKHNEDLGQTLATWGVGDGPYLVLPFLGPSTLRDTTGMVIEIPEHPVNQNINDTEEFWATAGLMFIDKRAQLLGASKVVDQAALDNYVFVRDAYLQHRRSLIYDGNPPREKFKDSPAGGPSEEDLELELELERELQSAPKP
ncbi:MAG: VacJ family lipoprotein [Gammaproteobacteria bacterium]